MEVKVIICEWIVKVSFIFQNLTEFNTAHNRRIASVAELVDVPNPLKRKNKTVHITFADEEDIINPGMS